MDNPGVEIPSVRWTFPEATRFGKIIAKEKILKLTKASPAEKKKLKAVVQRVRCSHEITSDAVNIAVGSQVPKILIIRLEVAVPEPDENVLSAVDTAFGVPVIFDIRHESRFKYAACRRCRGTTGKTPWTFSPYFSGPWTDIETHADPLPLALNLDILYEKLLTRILPLNPDEKESFDSLITRWEKVRELNREGARLENRIQKEKQFNRKVDLNRSLNRLKQQIEKISGRSRLSVEGLK